MSLTRCLLLASIVGVLAAVGAEAVRAQTTPPSAETAAPPPSVLPALSAGPFGFLSASANSANLLDDMGGLTPALDKYGISLKITENAETFGNLTGGVQQGFEVNGLTTVQVQLKTQKFGLDGGLFNVSGLHIWGGNLSETYLDNLQTVTGVEADPTIRLWELWYQQNFGNRFDIKIGEQSLDQEFEFMDCQKESAVFLNSMMGWPMLASADLYGGGPDYPLAALGVRAHAQMTDATNVLAGVFNGSPIPKNSPNTQLSNPNGVSFPLNTGIFAIAELQFTYGGSGASAKPSADGPLKGTYKIGAWYDSDSFDDLQYDDHGVPLASPASNGIPASHHGNYSIYGVLNQMIWSSKDDSKPNISVFVRPMFTTLEDRNLINFSVNAGLTVQAPLSLAAIVGRADDTFGLGMGVARVSSSASGYDKDLEFYEPTVYTPVRGTETFLEATYQIAATKWLQTQPDIQYVFNPGAGLANPNDPTQKIKNELVIGLRTNITF